MLAVDLVKYLLAHEVEGPRHDLGEGLGVDVVLEFLGGLAGVLGQNADDLGEVLLVADLAEGKTDAAVAVDADVDAVLEEGRAQGSGVAVGEGDGVEVLAGLAAGGDGLEAVV